MPTAVGPNTKGEENLVFGYDLGDTRNSFKNPPSTNLVHVDVARGTTSGWDGYSVHTGFNLTNNGNGPKDGRPDTVSVTWNDQGAETRTGDWYPRFNLRNPDGSLVTTNGGEVFYASWEYKYEGEEFLTSGPPDFTTENFYGNGWKSGTHGVITTLRTKELPFGWKRRTARIVAGDSGTTQTPLYRFGSGYKRANGGNFTLWLDNIIITRDHPTKRWYPGQTSVSSTQGLRDLARNTTIDISSVTFDSNARMTFDGTDDSIDLGADQKIYLTLDSWTTEFILYPPTGTATYWNFLFGDQLGGNGGYWMFHNNGNLSYYEGSFAGSTKLSSLGQHTLGGEIPYDQHSHIAIVYEGTGQFRTYLNGNPQQAFVKTFNQSHSLRLRYIGGGAGRYGEKSMPYFKNYDRALTAREVKRNFNAIKGRFNI